MESPLELFIRPLKAGQNSRFDHSLKKKIYSLLAHHVSKPKLSANFGTSSIHLSNFEGNLGSKK